MLSHTHRTDESMTRIVNREYAQAVAAQISKKLVSAERALNTIADAENPRCENCGSRSVFSRGRNGPYFYCEKECGWTADLRKASRSTRGPRRDEGKKEALRCPECGNAMRIREGRYGSFYGCTRYPECRGTVRIQ
jgi:DNA topoisomerase-1